MRTLYQTLVLDSITNKKLGYLTKQFIRKWHIDENDRAVLTRFLFRDTIQLSGYKIAVRKYEQMEAL